ncbi:type IV pilin protein [Pleionea sp. CnH1-48]|uniref:type IV pilin protein n=1 Tax=Pleionea sp. CnH1-48 TaxID=2954494 RepID=UPI002097275C|nr:type IV pilin protein [Pleionea sp. CnH1-48]MCO7222868.1 prepilin-type N-terminal cleavage/methylation domain-containing protein [Pleionea sp. CnH1-48]
MKAKGFTLVEVMVVLAIIGIIAAIANSSYSESIAKSKRSDGMGALMNAANAMERHRAANYKYSGAVAGTTFTATVPADGGRPYYNITISNLSDTEYTLTATAVNSMADYDGSLTLTNTGVKTWVDKKGTTHNCWPESGASC